MAEWKVVSFMALIHVYDIEIEITDRYEISLEIGLHVSGL